MNIRGIPIPYGAPNAQAHVERLIGTLRRECLDRMLIWNERHLRAVLGETVDWYKSGSQCFTSLCAWNSKVQLFGWWSRGWVRADL